MKSEKGITLISLIVYVIVMLIVVTIVGTITSYFYANVNTQYEDLKDKNNETTLDMYLTNDLKNEEIEITYTEEGNDSQIKLLYTDGSYVIYTITDDGIYRNAVKIYNKEETTSLNFKVVYIEPTESLIHEDAELRIMQEEKIFKSYTVNVKPKAVYTTPTVN